MFLFGRNKLKIRSEEDEDRFKIFVGYYSIKQKDAFKEKVLEELIGDNLCLGVMDSKLFYCGPQEESKITFIEMVKHLEFTRIPYKKIEIKKIPEVSMFGLTVKKGSKKTDKDYVYGFVVNKDNFKLIEEHVKVNKLNIYYFIDRTGLAEEALFKKLEENYEDIDEMGKDFYYQIFDNNFMNQLVISSEIERSEEIKEIVDKCYSEL
ncbi:hypothetical protein [Clostridium saccharoperbutylacetonicum]|uniref:hypothetical protein n=1 Tax=Clostridium saccharoperbutylacetonicum TaxID=36745 RepID=UPI0039E805A0